MDDALTVEGVLKIEVRTRFRKKFGNPPLGQKPPVFCIIGKLADNHDGSCLLFGNKDGIPDFIHRLIIPGVHDEQVHQLIFFFSEESLGILISFQNDIFPILLNQ